MRMRVLVDLHLYLTDGDANATSNGAAVRQVQMAKRVFPIIAANDLNISARPGVLQTAGGPKIKSSRPNQVGEIKDRLKNFQRRDESRWDCSFAGKNFLLSSFCLSCLLVK